VIALVRHAESTWVAEGRFQGRQDPPLSTLGVRQAALLAARLRDRARPPALPVPAAAPAVIRHSPLGRTAATARAIASALDDDVPLQPDPDLIELGQGEWEGLLHADVEARWPGELSLWRTDATAGQAPGGERLVDGAARVRDALATLLGTLGDRAAADHADRSTGSVVVAPWAILVSHDGILRLALMTLLGIPLDRFWSLPFPLTGITVVQLANGAPRLLAHGLTGHLASIEDEVGTTTPGTDRGGAL
jgi:probable phosphoglycerate mutase